MVKSLSMKSLLQRRWIVLIFSIIAVFMLVWLAAGLSELRFLPAQPLNFGGEDITPVRDILNFIKSDLSEIPTWQVGAVLVLFFVFFALAIIIMPAEVRKRMLRTLFRAILIGFAVFYYFDNYELLESPLTLNFSTSIGNSEAADGISISPEVYEPPSISPLLIYFISAIFALILIFAAWRMLRPWIQEKRELDLPLRGFGYIARTSLDDLSEGQQWEDVIIRAYMQMSEIARDRRGVSRQQAMTPNEFSAHLELAGLPPEPVQRLTRLFEKIRYGGRKANDDEVDEARGCLKAIAAACGEPL